MQVDLNADDQGWGYAQTDCRAQPRLGEYSGKANPAEQGSPLPAGEVHAVVQAESLVQKPTGEETASNCQSLLVRHHLI
jgi:hypothetical protein